MERKHVAFEVKAVDVEAGTFKGHASIFNIPDDGTPPDIMLPGAFAKTAKEWGPSGKNRVKILALHRSDWLPIGIPSVLQEDLTGLYFEGKISDTVLGRDILTLMRDGVLTEMSIGFDVVKHEYDSNLDVRYLKEVRLYEISPVIWAMHPLATIDGVKSKHMVINSYQPALAAQPEIPTAPSPAASILVDPDMLQSIKALTAEVKAASQRSAEHAGTYNRGSKGCD